MHGNGLKPNRIPWKLSYRQARTRSAEIWHDFIRRRYHFISSGLSRPEIKLPRLDKLKSENRKNAFDLA